MLPCHISLCSSSSPGSSTFSGSSWSRPLGGSALGGFIRDGHYYLSLQGSYTEVSAAIWERLRLHELIVIFSTPVAILCFVVFLFSAAFPAIAGMRRGPALDERVCDVFRPLANGSAADVVAATSAA